MRSLTPALIVLALVTAGCSGSTETSATPEPSTSTESEATTTVVADETTEEPADTTEADDSTEELFPDVVGAVATQAGDGTWDFSVTLSSPYDSPDRYADSWRVRSADGTVYGERFLTHDHANEQPFTRSQAGIEIPEDVTIVVIEGRDQISGWGGALLELELDRS